MMIYAWEKALCLLAGFTLYALVKVMDHYVDKDRKEKEVQ